MINGYVLSGIPEKYVDISRETELEIRDAFERINNIKEVNQLKVINAFREVKLSDSHFSGTTGYGYDDVGREKLEEAMSMIMGTQDTLLRFQISSGTQAICCALFGVLRPGDVMLSVTGRPYDTLSNVIGDLKQDNSGSLADFGIGYRQIELLENGCFNNRLILDSLCENVKVVFIQKSRGYTSRRALLNEEIGETIRLVKAARPDIRIIVDNCYGEFTQVDEPGNYGADIVCGSLIKNPGGGIATTGGYIACRAELKEQIAGRLTAPGVGSHIGPTLGMNRMIALGLYLAPHTVSEAIKGAVFSSAFFRKLGFITSPGPNDIRGDIVQSFEFGNPELVTMFCRSIQSASPVDSFVTPYPWDMPGYDCQVIMAAGAFTQGASIEMSCDAPIKPPFIAYFQGGIVYENVKFAALLAASRMENMIGRIG